jgi:hypothetical protein
MKSLLIVPLFLLLIFASVGTAKADPFVLVDGLNVLSLPNATDIHGVNVLTTHAQFGSNLWNVNLVPNEAIIYLTDSSNVLTDMIFLERLAPDLTVAAVVSVGHPQLAALEALNLTHFTFSATIIETQFGEARFLVIDEIPIILVLDPPDCAVPSAVPEPASMFLFASGLGGIALRKYRKRKRAVS